MIERSGFPKIGSEWKDWQDGWQFFTHDADECYHIADFAADDPDRFHELIANLSPRDQEIMLLFALLRKRPTDLSVVFGNARIVKDLYKAAHKLAGLIAFGPAPAIATIHAILERVHLGEFGRHNLAACIWQYSRSRDFREVERLIGQRGLRQQMLRTFKTLHASREREEGLLAGWLLWLVDGSDPRGIGWRKRKRTGHVYKLGPTVFHTDKQLREPSERERRRRRGDLRNSSPAIGRGGQGQRPDIVKIPRYMKFIWTDSNA